MKKNIRKNFLLVFLGLTLFITLYSTASSIQKIEEPNFVFLKKNGLIAAPAVLYLNDFFEISGRTFVYRGESEFDISDTIEFENEFITINQKPGLIFIQGTNDLKKITYDTSHLVCSRIDVKTISALKEIKKPFFLELPLRTALKNVKVLNSLPLLSHLKIIVDNSRYNKRFHSIEGINALAGLNVPNLFIKTNVDETEHLKEILDITNCTQLHVETSRKEIFKYVGQMKNLKNLKISYSGTMKSDDLKSLKKLTNLKKLTLSAKSIDSKASFQISKLKQLTHLDINDGDRSGSGFLEIASLPNLLSLKIYSDTVGSYTNFKIPEKSFEKLILLKDNSPNFFSRLTASGITFSDNLKSVQLNRAKSGNLYSINGRKKLRFLEYQAGLNFSDNKVLSSLTGLEYLNLSNSNADDATLKYINKLENLTTLNLEATKITNKGIDYIVELPNLKNLRLSRTKINRGALVSINRMEKLTFLDVSDTKIIHSFIYKTKKEIKDLIREKLKNEDLPQFVFKSYFLQLYGINMGFEEEEESEMGDFESFDCAYTYSPVKDHILYLLNGFSGYYNTTLNFHNDRTQEDNDLIHSFVLEKTGEPLILKKLHFNAGDLNQYNRKSIKKIYDILKLQPDKLTIRKLTPRAMYRSFIYKAVRKRVRDVVRLLKPPAEMGEMVSFYKKQLQLNEYGPEAQYKTWQKFYPEPEKECFKTDESEITGFLLRRYMDGTLSCILEIILDFLNDYDPGVSKKMRYQLSRHIDSEKSCFR